MRGFIVVTDRSLITDEKLAERIAALDTLGAVRDAAASGMRLYLVGGVVRDLLLGAEVPGDLDVAVDGEVEELVVRLGAPGTVHERFGTASVDVAGMRVDLARTRAETYVRPGALPDVAPAGIEDDLSRRDFSVSAIAVSLDDAPAVIDPHSGRADLEAGLIRILHASSFRDDPTRALRAARYCARLSFEPAEDTLDPLRQADLTTVSGDRIRAELERIAEEPAASGAFALLADWGLADIDEAAPGRIDAVLAVLGERGWEEVAGRTDVVLAAALPDPAVEAGALRLAAAHPESPSAAVRLARGRSGVELVVARAAGAGWLDQLIREWRHVKLEISGGDLLAAGVEEGPAIGAGLEAARAAKLDGAASGREQELAAALRAVST